MALQSKSLSLVVRSCKWKKNLARVEVELSIFMLMSSTYDEEQLLMRTRIICGLL